MAERAVDAGILAEYCTFCCRSGRYVSAIIMPICESQKLHRGLARHLGPQLVPNVMEQKPPVACKGCHWSAQAIEIQLWGKGLATARPMCQGPAADGRRWS